MRNRLRLGIAVAGLVVCSIGVAVLTTGTVSAKKPGGGGGQFCGGIAGIPCPEGFTCVDNPRDNCDPKTGGADCGGICVR